MNLGKDGVELGRLHNHPGAHCSLDPSLAASQLCDLEKEARSHATSQPGSPRRSRVYTTRRAHLEA